MQCRTDGDLRAKLRAHLAALQPVELVVPSGQLSATTWKARRFSALASADIRLDEVVQRAHSCPFSCEGL